MVPAVLLSIVVPFHNSAAKSERLVSTLANLRDERIELVLVDDGSTDDTVERLRRVSFNVPAKIITQENKGPGGARNTGLDQATGEYVWFVDSDDDIDPAAVDLLASLAGEGYDFIDFNVISGGRIDNTMGLAEGEHEVKDPASLVRRWGRIWTKMLCRRWLLEHGIRYPECTLFEDNFLLFVFPFVTVRFFKSNQVAYFHTEDSGYTTETLAYPPRYFDRIATATAGLNAALRRQTSAEAREAAVQRFVDLYAIRTVNVSRRPDRTWLLKMHVFRTFRGEAARLGVKSQPTFGGSAAHRAVMALLWLLSFALPLQWSRRALSPPPWDKKASRA
jgi:glycosyltransferase involved in cell wall biosynthesis